ncbi:hypothetical protein ACFCWG_27400 [Streptomyces sp. NPDC056390]|uniref:hypothetical protein n=1 Tax=Streptomyces sp. NPDC056390 TaxID=3345806 RepID=UPI0035DEB919
MRRAMAQCRTLEGIPERGDTRHCRAELPHRWRPLEPRTRVLIVGIASHVQISGDRDR